MADDQQRLKVSKSKIHGMGTFADKAIFKGELFYEIPIGISSKKPKEKWARIGDRYVCDEKILNFVNHSCEPNSFIDLVIPALLAIKDISVGEEITVDYNRTELDGTKVICNCKSLKCKGYLKREQEEGDE